MNDLSGKRSGKLTVIGLNKDNIRINGELLWECKCDCGNTTFVVGSKLKGSHTKSCGCNRRRRGKNNPKFKDLRGQRFSKLLVIGYAGKKYGQNQWRCKCDCGNKVNVSVSHLTSGHNKSCGCLKNRKFEENKLFVDLTGMKFNRLVVLELDKSKGHSGFWKCKCDCGNIVIVGGPKLKNGHTKSCGCLRRRSDNDSNNSKLWKIWFGMIRRCNDVKHDSYKSYGGRNITYDSKWGEYIGFKNDMWNRFNKFYKLYGDNISLERIDVNGNYCKENCTFIHKRDQAGNRRNNRWFRAIDPDGNEYISKNAAKFGRDHKLDGARIIDCLKNLRYQHKKWTFYYI